MCIFKAYIYTHIHIHTRQVANVMSRANLNFFNIKENVKTAQTFFFKKKHPRFGSLSQLCLINSVINLNNMNKKNTMTINKLKKNNNKKKDVQMTSMFFKKQEKSNIQAIYLTRFNKLN